MSLNTADTSFILSKSNPVLASGLYTVSKFILNGMEKFIFLLIGQYWY
jgi:hypothetical protein